MNRRRVGARIMAVLILGVCAQLALADDSDWMQYGGHEGGGRYSPLAQINRDNVQNLAVAWSYRTGALDRHPNLLAVTGFQATPILLPQGVGGHLVTCTPFNRVIALDPETGKERWFFDPEIDLGQMRFSGRFNCRGLSQWRDPKAEANAVCAHRLFLATNDRRLLALDARNGKLCADFGDDGIVDVTPIIVQIGPVDQLDSMQLMSPVAVVNGVVIMGGTANKFKSASSMNGALRAFDARSGEHLWTFDTLIRDSSDPDTSEYSVGGANVWTTMSWDSERDLLFAPTASASPNFYGALRPGDNRYANSVLAIRASTGELVWHFQAVHHDIWDWDMPTHPILVDITRNGEKIPVVIQLTKTGIVFVFHRETGEPFFPIEERPVPTDGVAGDVLSPTQPFPVKPPPLMKVGLTADDAWGFMPFDRNACRDKIASMRSGGYYTPVTEQGTVMYPMVGGGSNWWGGAFDPQRNILVTPVSQFPSFVKLIPNDEIDPELAKSPTAGVPMGPPGYISGTDYGMQIAPLMSPIFSPCSKPPWSLLVAVDMDRGEILWQTPLGVLDKLMPIPLPLKFGTPFSGGAISTGGGLVFIGASYDERFRAHDIDSGEILWEIGTPYSANATPMTYSVNGRQYVVVSAGGHPWSPLAKGDYLMAYALSE